MAVDTPERRDAIRGSAEVSAAKHLARTYGVSMRRRRRVGPVVYDIGLTARSDPAATTLHGELRFTDDGHLEWSRLFGQELAGITMLELASLLEFGPQPEESTTLVLTEAPDIITAPIMIIPDDPRTGPIVVQPVIPQPPRRRALTAPRGRAIVSVPVRVVVAAPPRRRAPTLAERRAAVLAETPDPRKLWARLFLGVLLTIASFALLFVAVTVPVRPEHWVPIIGGIALFGAWGVGLSGSAIKANDQRLAALQAVS